MFQFEMSATSSSPVVNSAVGQVCSLPILNFNIKNIYSRKKNLKALAAADSQRSEEFIEFPIKAEGGPIVSVHRPSTKSKGEFLGC